MAAETTEPDAGVVLDLIESFRRSKTMFAAVSLGVFDGLAAGPLGRGELASALGADPDALGRLLDACVGLKLLTKHDARYANTPVATTYLTKSSPSRLTGYINFSNEFIWKLWANLEGAVRE